MIQRRPGFSGTKNAKRVDSRDVQRTKIATPSHLVDRSENQLRRWYRVETELEGMPNAFAESGFINFALTHL